MEECRVNLQNSYIRLLRRYKEIIDKTEDDEDQLSEQNILISQIIMRKHKMFVISLNLLSASIFLPYYLVLIVFLIMHQIKN